MAIWAIGLAMTMALGTPENLQNRLPELTVRGKSLVDPQGRAVLLKGVNLGSYLVIEPWMLTMTEGPEAFRDHYEFEEILASRFGQTEKERLMNLWRESWLSERDFQIIRDFGMNVVRLPINYRVLEDDSNPKVIKPEGWRWIDRVVDLGEKYGIYTILDLHGAQGGQSVYDHTGRVGQNKLWSEPANQERFAWLWSEMAKRYRDRSAVVAYDVLNEPYGGTKPQQVALFQKVLPAIRAVDSDTLIYAPGNWDSFDHYGDPKSRGWRNVGFTMHYYPGLFGGGPPTPRTHARHLAAMDGVAAIINRLEVPFLVGEMNVVFQSAGGGAMMRRHFDTYAGHGWATTMWAFKAMSTDGGHGDASWGMVTNIGPARRINLRTAPKAEIEEWMRRFATEPYALHEDLKKFLTAANPELPPLPEIPKPVRTVPYRDTLPGWTATDIGNPISGGLRVLEAGKFELYGGGHDIWGTSDQFRFLHRTLTGDFDLEVVVADVVDVDGYTKAGLLIRASLDPSAAMALLSVFPSGELQFAARETTGGEAGGPGGPTVTFPEARLRLMRRGDVISASYSMAGGLWRDLGSRRIPGLPRSVFAGAVALSHDNTQLVKVTYQDLKATPR